MFLGMALVLAACDRPNDVPRLQDEVSASAKTFHKRLDDLADRLQTIGKRGDALGKNAETGGEAYKDFHEAKSIVDEQRRRLDAVPQAIQAAAKSGNPEELQKLYDQMSESVDDALTEATWKADAAESWIALAEQHADEPATEPASAPPPSSEPPATETPSTTGTGAQPGTAAAGPAATGSAATH